MQLYTHAYHDDSAEDTKKRVEQEGRQCLLIPANLMKDEDCKRIVDEHVKKYGRIDVLINNASKQIQCKDLADIEPDNVRSTFHSNIVGMIVLTKFALPHIKRGGTIVNSASVTAYKGSAGMLDCKQPVHSHKKALAQALQLI